MHDSVFEKLSELNISGQDSGHTQKHQIFEQAKL